MLQFIICVIFSFCVFMGCESFKQSKLFKTTDVLTEKGLRSEAKMWAVLSIVFLVALIGSVFIK